MRLKVTAAMERHLSELQGSKNAAKGGVMLIPRMATPEGWEAEAQPHQRALMEWSMQAHGGPAVREPLPQPMDAQQERAFEMYVHNSRSLGLTPEQKAAKAFTAAMKVTR